MNIDNEYKNKLINMYRTDTFETEDIDLSEIDELISDEDLKAIISINNTEMSRLINKEPLEKELIKKMLVANLNFYKLAKSRELSIPGSSFLMTIASSINYDVDKVYEELTVGRYNRSFKNK